MADPITAPAPAAPAPGNVAPPAAPDWKTGLSDAHLQVVNDSKFESVGSVFDALSAKGDWMHGLTPELKGMLEAKKFTTPTELATSYQNLETLKGVPADRLLTRPEKSIEHDADAWKSLYSQLGCPETPEGYTVAVGEGQQIDEKLATAAEASFHQLGLSKVQGEGIIAMWNSLNAADTKANTDFLAQEKLDTENKLKTEWGQAFEKNQSLVAQTPSEFGLETGDFEKIASVLGLHKANKFLLAVAEKRGEATFHKGDGPTGGPMSPDAAEHKFKQLMADKEFLKKYSDKDVDAMETIRVLNGQRFNRPAMT